MLSICIPSYNRPIELERLLKSILKVNSDLVEVVISDDASPKQNLIDEVVKKYANNLKINYFPRSTNLGYDLNLMFLAENASNEYVMFIGDDDIIEPANFESFLYNLSLTKVDFVLTPVYGSEGCMRRCFSKSFSKEDLSRSELAKLAFECILFSGLVFRTSKLRGLNIEGLENSIYIQIFSSLVLASESGFAYINTPLVKVGQDGESGFGHNNVNDSELQDRSSLLADFNYHIRLKKVIEIFSDRYIDIKLQFNRLYCLRLINRYLNVSIADKNYLSSLNTIIIKNQLAPKLYVYLLYILFSLMPVIIIRRLTVLRYRYFDYESKRTKI